MKRSKALQDSLRLLLRALKLPSFLVCYPSMAEQAEKENWSFEQFLSALCEQEIEDRERRRILRLLKNASLPKDKTRTTLNDKRLPAKVRRLLPKLYEGQFADRAENILLFGLPGRGKTHVACAIAHALVEQGRPVLFVSTVYLVQRLLAAKRDLGLERALAKLDRYEVVVLDDIGYVQQEKEEMDVLFTFLAQRYERKSVIVTSNLVFSEWDKIFKNAMMTAAAIDRLVHHSVVLELDGPSIRAQDAQRRSNSTKKEGRK